MPETAMNEDSQLAAGEDQVRAARQLFAVQAIPVAKTVDEATDDHFRGGVLPTYPSH